MLVKILGTRGEIEAKCPRHTKHTGILIDGELLLDVGEKEFLIYNPKWILLTHLHPDHAYFMRWGYEENPVTKAIIYAPEIPSHKKISSEIQILNERKKIGPFTVTPIPTHHSKNVKSQGYLIEKKGTSMLYTGDLVWIDKEYHPLFKSVKLIITDGSFIREGGMIKKDKDTQKLYGHNGIPNLIRLFKGSSQNILFIHFGSWFYKNVAESKEKISALGKKNEVNAFAGYDGFEIEIL